MKVSANLTEEKVSGSNNIKSHMENTVVKIVDLEKEINEDIDRIGGCKKLKSMELLVKWMIPSASCCWRCDILVVKLGRKLLEN